MREIYKPKKGKDFYRDSLEYMEYDPEALISDDEDDDCQEDEVISHKLVARMETHDTKTIKIWKK